MARKDVGSMYATLGLDISQLTRGLARAEQRMQQAGRSMQRAGRMMSLYITAPLAAIGVGAFRAGKDFESSMSKIVGLVGVASDQVEAWKDELLKLAPALGKSPTELADAMFFVTSSGLRGKDALEALVASAKAASSGLGETKIVADLVTSAMNAYGTETLNAQKATDVLVAAVREGKAEASELAQSMGMVLPIASALGVSFDQVGAAVAAMTRTGTGASTAAMQLRQILASILNPANQSEEALEQMGTSSEALRKTIREDGLIAALKQLRKIQNKYGTEALGTVIPNIRALSGVLDIVGSNMEENVGIFERMTDTTGSLDKAFEAASETAQFKWNQAISQSKASLIELWKALRGPITTALTKFQKNVKAVTEAFKSLTDEEKGQLIKTATLIGAGGPLLIALGTLTRALAALISPLGLVFALFAGISAGALYLAGNWEVLTNKLDEKLDKSKFWSFMLGKHFMNTGFDQVIDDEGNVIEKTEELENKWKSFGEVVEDVVGKLFNSLGTLAEKFNIVTDSADKTGEAFSRGLEIPAKMASKGVGEVSLALAEVNTSVQTTTSNSVLATDLLREAFNGMQTSVSMAVSNSKNVLQGFWKFFKDFIKGMIIKLMAAVAATILLAVALSALGLSGPAGFLGSINKASKMIGTENLAGGLLGLDSGGIVTQGGLFKVHKDEVIVPLAAGTAVTPAGGMGNIHVTIESVQRGEDIYNVVKTVERKKGNVL